MTPLPGRTTRPLQALAELQRIQQELQRQNEELGKQLELDRLRIAEVSPPPGLTADFGGRCTVT